MNASVQWDQNCQNYIQQERYNCVIRLNQKHLHTSRLNPVSLLGRIWSPHRLMYQLKSIHSTLCTHQHHPPAESLSRLCDAWGGCEESAGGNHLDGDLAAGDLDSHLCEWRRQQCDLTERLSDSRSAAGRYLLFPPQHPEDSLSFNHLHWITCVPVYLHMKSVLFWKLQRNWFRYLGPRLTCPTEGLLVRMKFIKDRRENHERVQQLIWCVCGCVGLCIVCARNHWICLWLAQGHLYVFLFIWMFFDPPRPNVSTTKSCFNNCLYKWYHTAVVAANSLVYSLGNIWKVS